MSASAAVISTRSTADAPAKAARSKLVRIDGRTRMSRRIEELKTIYIAAVSEAHGARALSPMTMIKIEDAATTRAIAEMARQRFITADGTMSADDLVRIENRAARAERALRLGVTTAIPSISISPYLAGRR